ncbi:hypothetical protein [Sphingobacterium hungaricum]|uniref:CarboxypepD_reg-like domain-containing protein n=1 Tax=Sphingobacterium hungaricum TaxID=2082723 RepID=A0A928UVX2_9SPHI|nr:hypothetical protein [Sphingobacterium hungaricum]MBE8714205.1 hypothetical protein [Sphingobacterium hungaricum]
MRSRKVIFLFLIFCVCSSAFAQQKKLVQFSGLIYAQGIDITVPYVTVRNTSYGDQTFSATHEGYFSFVAHVGDTISFSSVGYETLTFVIPETNSDKYTAHIEMKSMVTELPAVTVGPPFPYASIEEFTIAFLALNLNDDDIMMAKKNLSQQALSTLALIMPRSAEEIQSQTNVQRHSNLSNKAINQNFANPLLNPFAWGALIDQIKRGDYSREKLKY